MSQGLSRGVASQAQRLTEALKNAWSDHKITRRDLALAMKTEDATVSSMKSQITKWANNTYGISDPNAERLSNALNELLGENVYDLDYFKKDPNAPKIWELAARLATLEAKVDELPTARDLKRLGESMRREIVRAIRGNAADQQASPPKK